MLHADDVSSSVSLGKIDTTQLFASLCDAVKDLVMIFVRWRKECEVAESSAVRSPVAVVLLQSGRSEDVLLGGEHVCRSCTVLLGMRDRWS